ncbi:MAG: hypothetical protein IT380_16385 [Myxococcales bacterium]|nr:hypothetical protein [Myxococcales bacterium]
MTMSEMELPIWCACGMENPAALRALNSMLARIPLEAPTGKLCPKCGKRVPVKAKDREREQRTMAGRGAAPTAYSSEVDRAFQTKPITHST